VVQCEYGKRDEVIRIILPTHLKILSLKELGGLAVVPLLDRPQISGYPRIHLAGLSFGFDRSHMFVYYFDI
jgi:hypothetical protein